MTDPIRQALEALEEIDEALYVDGYGNNAIRRSWNERKMEAAITALRAHLDAPAAQPVSEPQQPGLPAEVVELLDELEDARIEAGTHDTGVGQALAHAIDWIHAAALDTTAAQPVAEPAGWREALEFYARQSHFAIADEEAWDTVSGEPQNFWCDEAGTATVEDGSVARMALAGTPLPNDDDDAAQPVAEAVPTEAQIERLYHNSYESTVTFAAFKRIVRLTLEAFPHPTPPERKPLSDEHRDIKRMRDALHAVINAAQCAKTPCGPSIDPAHPVAVRNAKLASIAGIAAQGLGYVNGPPPLGDDAPLIARLRNEWHEDDGSVCWWAWCGKTWAGEPPWIGTPLDDDWPGYHTHWTPRPPAPANGITEGNGNG